MGKKVSSAAQTETPSSIPDQMDPQHVSLTLISLKKMGIDKPIPQSCDTSGFYSHFFGSFIKVNHIKKGRISCTISVKPPISCLGHVSGVFKNYLNSISMSYHTRENAYGTLHGGSVGSYIELLSTACARTVIAEDKELFLGEINVSYLSGAPISAEVLAEASVVKSGRNVTMVALEFKLKKTGNLIYIAHATFYNIPVAKL